MKIMTFFIGLLLSVNLMGQADFPFKISLEPFTINGVSGLHSYAMGQYDGKWVVIGGRLDGLHARQPFNAFPASQNNQSIFVISPENNSVQSTTINSLPLGLREQLQSTNMQFFQDGDYLIIVGGYGYSHSEGDHITYPYLTVVDLPKLVESIENGMDISDSFQQIADDYFAVTGGNLGKIGEEYYLVGGHRFDGRYNPMNMPTFIQTYTDGIRKFTIDGFENNLSFESTGTISYAIHLHRRDNNLLPQIYPDGTFGYTIFSGVFQINQNLPFLYPVDITAEGYQAIESFNQYLSHYHSAKVALFDENENSMHNLFFGGMSQFYYENENLIQDNNVPFVKTISRVSRDSEGILTEVKLPIEMPDLLGASAEFFINEDLQFVEKDIINISNIQTDSVLLGYIFGGIHSNGLNPFSQNNTGITSASTQAFKVWIARENSVNTTQIPSKGYHKLSLSVLPNPVNESTFRVEISAPELGDLEVLVCDTNGQIVINEYLEGASLGKNTIEIELEKEAKGVHFVTVILNGKYSQSAKLIVR